MNPRLYLDDAYVREFSAELLEARDGRLRLSRTAFFPGGGGQPADRGFISLGDRHLVVSDVGEDEAGDIWHGAGLDVEAGTTVVGAIDWPYRYALMRHHSLMHIVNAVALSELGGCITGVQIGPGRSRIDFKLERFARDGVAALEGAVNAVLARNLAVTSFAVTEEFRKRPELVRTLNVAPPVVAGLVRVVEMAGFDAQACGGTHVRSTAEIGPARVIKYDNKGKDNKRFYWELVG